MARESRTAKRERAARVVSILEDRYPQRECPLDHNDPFTLTIAVLLSAQTTDANVNRVTPELFRRWPDAPTMAAADVTEVEKVIHSLGFFRSKAKHCVQCAQMICNDFGGAVPADMKELQKLPGVGRKTANIVLTEGFGIVEGIAVDTHVFRIAHKLDLSRAQSAADTEKDLLALVPRDKWGIVNRTWIRFGREICDARNPQCAVCPLAELCPGK